MGKKLGYFCKMLIGQGGSTPSIEMKLVTNLTPNGTLEAIDATDRSTGGYKSYLPGLKDYQIDGTLHWDNANANINLFRLAWLQHTTIAVFANDGNGGGLDADFIVTSWKENQQNNAPISYDFTLQINADTRVPTLYAPASSGSSGSALPNVSF